MPVKKQSSPVPVKKRLSPAPVEVLEDISDSDTDSGHDERARTPAVAVDESTLHVALPPRPVMTNALRQRYSLVNVFAHTPLRLDLLPSDVRALLADKVGDIGTRAAPVLRCNNV